MSVCEEELDWMSALPDAILHKILFVANQTFSSNQHFIQEIDPPLELTPVIHIPMYSPYKHITPSECTFIRNSLAQHQAPKLHKFSLQFSTGPLRDHDPDVQHCIEFAISRQVQILSVSAHLCTAVLEQYYVLPNMFYSHDNVRSLEQVSLKGFLFDSNPPCDLPFVSLKTLCFFDCVINDIGFKVPCS